MDTLAALLAHFSLHAGVFYTGNICGIHEFERDALRGHLHLVRRGPIKLSGVQIDELSFDEPTLIFLPRPERHSFAADDRSGADVVCGTIQFGHGGRNPITDSLPDLVVVPLRAIDGMNNLLELMFHEAFANHSGRQAILDRLCEVLIVWLLRHCLSTGITQGGTLAGLADPRLAKTLQAIHAQPQAPWDLHRMADAAGMSRARFAAHFKEVTGETPADYLGRWRMMVAQRMLKSGRTLPQIADAVGYGSASALSRAFCRQMGCTPLQWLKDTLSESTTPQ